jgi:hypothetical protein
LFKIGHSKLFKRRFRDINANSPLPLVVVKYGKCDNPDLLEDYLHDIFKNKYFKNNWYSLDKNDFILIEDIFSRFFKS